MSGAPLEDRDLRVADHEIHAFFPVSYGSEKERRHPERLLQDWSARIERITHHAFRIAGGLDWDEGDAESVKLWNRMKEGRGMAVTDLYRHVSQILGQEKGNQEPHLCNAYELTSSNPLSHSNGSGHERLFILRLKANGAAARRCNVEEFGMQFRGARLYVFRTGIAVLDLSWQYKYLSFHQKKQDGGIEARASREKPVPGILLEGNYILSRAAPESPRDEQADQPSPRRVPRRFRLSFGKEQDGGVDAWPSKYTPTPETLEQVDPSGPQAIEPSTLFRIADALLPQGDAPSKVHGNRRILYSLATLDAAVAEPDFRRLAVRLGARWNPDYKPSEAFVERASWSPFPYVCHGITEEGGSSIVYNPGMESEFASNFVRSSGRNTYVPLFVSSLHNHFWLLDQTEWIPARRRKADSRAETEDLQEVYERTVDFRRYFYFPVVSQISLHNAFFRRWSEALRVDDRLRFLEHISRDLTEVIRARRARWLGRASGGIGGYLITHEILSQLSNLGLPGFRPSLDSLFVERSVGSLEHTARLLSLIANWEIGIFLGSVLGGLLGLWLTWNFGKTDRSG